MTNINFNDINNIRNRLDRDRRFSQAYLRRVSQTDPPSAAGPSGVSPATTLPSGATPPRRGSQDSRFFLETDLDIVNLELFGTMLSLTSSMYYLQASLIGREIILSQLNGTPIDLDAKPLVDVGEALLEIALFVFLISSFMRAEERNLDKALYPDTAQDPEPFERIAISLIPTVLANEVRIQARRDILSNLPDL